MTSLSGTLGGWISSLIAGLSCAGLVVYQSAIEYVVFITLCIGFVSATCAVISTVIQVKKHLSSGRAKPNGASR